MRRWPILLLTSLACPAAALPPCPIQPGQVMAYDILRGGKVIGHQTVRFSAPLPDTTVEIDVNAALYALGVKVYNYSHHGMERWQAGRMVSLVAQTDDDGTPRHVDAASDPSGTWHGTTGPAPGPAPLLASSLWNNQTVSATRLLDRETGAIVPVRVTPLPDESISLGNRSIAAHRYDLAGIVSGSAWYDEHGCWVRALFHTRVDGSLVEVRAH